MASYWEQLVEKHGLEGARDVMREFTKRRKTSGFAAMTPENRKKLASMGGKARQAQIAKLVENSDAESNHTR